MYVENYEDVQSKEPVVRILDNSRTLEDLQDAARRVLGEVLERFSI